ncbi:arylsulfatase A-like [Anneissia japonica]|uniref:arylsulfatase A-like n=1 Tax=Anneissia japonica TaxID=1529436 RepID=UPI0014255CA3|nr:arylsulfatase A-like [Anneissia japonica]XP_033106918.1 arylsulfatase A-like [Anneissia japonica]
MSCSRANIATTTRFTELLKLIVILLTVPPPNHVQCIDGKPPNIVIFMADDLGYGDLQSFGNPLSHTPNIDALIKAGIKFTQFYSASPICSPARAALLTGRYPIRTGVWNDVNNAIFLQENIGGLKLNETTVPEMLATRGYKSALIGKWHLGVGPEKEYLPTHHGFDHYFGVPNSHADCPCDKCFFPNDDCNSGCQRAKAPCQLLLDDEIIEQPVNLISLAERQTRAARSFIQSNSCEGTPFFLMYASLHPHVPHFAGERFRNTTIGGDYTDSLAEFDGEVGDVMTELRNSGVLENTLVLLTSDNGPDLVEKKLGGFSGVFRCGKLSTFEGGVRVPTVAYWKGRIRQGVSAEFLSHLDIWPTLRSISGLPSDSQNVELDGFDFSSVLFKNGKSPRESMLFYDITPDPERGPFAIRTTTYKAHFLTECSIRCDGDAFDEMCRSNSSLTIQDPPLIYDLLLDPEERDDIGRTSEALVAEMTQLLQQETNKVAYSESTLKEEDELHQLCCDPGCTPFPSCCDCPSQYADSLLPLYKDCKKLPLNTRIIYRKISHKC